MARRSWRRGLVHGGLAVRRKISRKPRAHFLHIGKTGGTAVKAALRDHQLTGRYEIVLHKHLFRFAEVPPGEKAFFVVRDPIDRYVSAFNTRLRQGRPAKEHPWSPAEKRAFEEFATADELGRALSSDDPGHRDRALRAMITITHVRSSYRDWIRVEEIEKRRESLLLVMWMPDLTTTFPRLRELLGLPEEVALSGDAIVSHRSPAGQQRTLSDVARVNLEHWFARDFAYLDYLATLDCFEGPSFVPRHAGASVATGSPG